MHPRDDVPALLVGYDDRDLFDPCLPYNRAHTFLGPTTVFYVPEGPFIISGLSGRRMILNPGSVGQPRDGDRRAAYAVYDGSQLHVENVGSTLAVSGMTLSTAPLVFVNPSDDSVLFVSNDASATPATRATVPTNVVYDGTAPAPQWRNAGPWRK